MQPFISLIMPWPGSKAINGWIFCQGQELSINQYQALYSLLGTTFGGNGVSTFKIPDLRGRVAVGANMNAGSGYQLGSVGGSENTPLTAANLPAHTHAATLQVQGSIGVKVSTSSAESETPSSNSMLAMGAELNGDEAMVPKIFGPVGGTSVSLGGLTATLTGTAAIGTTGGTAAAPSNMNPYLALNYLIAVEGIYPPQPY